MKYISTLMAGCLLCGLSACSSDEPTTGGGNTPAPETKDAVYSSIKFRIPQSGRSAATEGIEIGKNHENAVGSILVVLAEGTEADGYKFVTYALNDAPIADATENQYTITFQDKEVLFNHANSEVAIFAYCNPTPELRSIICGTIDPTTGAYSGGLATGADFTDAICNANVSSTWEDNGFLMTSVAVRTVLLPDEAKLKTCNTPEDAFPLGTVEVIRTASRFDFRDASPDPEDAPLTYTITNDDTHEVMGQVVLNRIALFNLRNEFYYLPRTKADADATTKLCPTFAGMEDGYILSPDARTITENLPDVIDPLNPTTSLQWVSLAAVLGKEEDEDTDESTTVDGFTGWFKDPVGDKTGYHIWRYATENTWAPGVEPTTAGTTGYVFEAEIKVAADFGNVDADGQLQTMYLYGKQLYANAMQIAEAIKTVPVSTLATAFENAFDITRDENGNITAATPKSDEIVENMGFTAYKPNSAGKYLCYYFAFNRHNDNDMAAEKGPMEFATVRNNVYKLAVTNITKFGKFKPDTDVEEWDTYFNLDVIVRPWQVRINNLEF